MPVCRHYGLYLFIDGARLGYGLTAPDNDLTLADITNNCDVFCIGGTKCGALLAKRQLSSIRPLKDDFRTIMKQGGAVLAKGRLLGLAIENLFTDGLYYKICRHGVELALQIKVAVQERGLGFVTDSTTNQQFIIFPQAMYDELSKQFALAPGGIHGRRQDRRPYLHQLGHRPNSGRQTLQHDQSTLRQAYKQNDPYGFYRTGHFLFAFRSGYLRHERFIFQLFTVMTQLFCHAFFALYKALSALYKSTASSVPSTG